MPYTAEIRANNPGCFLFLIDQSGSMAGRKAEAVTTAANRLLATLVVRCSKAGGVRDYFHVGLIGYGRDVASLLGGRLAGRTLVPISAVAAYPLRVETQPRKVDDGAGGLLDQNFRLPIWLEPMAGAGPTPLCQALDLALRILADFVVRFPGCYPPVVLNITDGEATDGDPEPHAALIHDLASEDGNALLFNFLLSFLGEQPIEFPDRETDLPDNYARKLFRMTSTLAPQMRATAECNGVPVTAETRGLICNADLRSLVRFLDIATLVDVGTRFNTRVLR